MELLLFLGNFLRLCLWLVRLRKNSAMIKRNNTFDHNNYHNNYTKLITNRKPEKIHKMHITSSGTQGTMSHLMSKKLDDKHATDGNIYSAKDFTWEMQFSIGSLSSLLITAIFEGWCQFQMRKSSGCFISFDSWRTVLEILSIGNSRKFTQAHLWKCHNHGMISPAIQSLNNVMANIVQTHFTGDLTRRAGIIGHPGAWNK